MKMALISTQDSGYYRNEIFWEMIWALDQNIYDMYESRLAKENKALPILTEDCDRTAMRMWYSNLWDPSRNTLGLKVRYDLKSGNVVYRYIYGELG
ncbi:MAG: hypothetical protein ACLU6Y_13815 [Ruminococcus sp.]